jgi:prepilin-type processing-associated H-X9-DG protein
MKDAVFPSVRIIRITASIVTIVVLAFVLAAVLGREKENTTRVASARNLQQWGIALNLYLIENDNQLPEIGKSPVTAEQSKAWFNILPLYLSEKPLAELPPGQRPRPGVPSLWIRPDSKPVKIWDLEVFYFNYGMNRNLQPVEGARSFRINEINFPGSVIFLVPTDGYSPDAGPEEVFFSKSGPPEAHILFCDGHVEVATRSKLLDPSTLSPPQTAKEISWFHQQ